MDIQSTMDIAASGMAAQATRMRVIAQNIANADSTAPAPGMDPYRRQQVTFKSVYDRTVGANVVKVVGVTPDNSAFKTKLDPANPAADANGYVQLPNVSTVIEQADLRQAQRSYEASLSSMELMKSVAMQTINTIR